MKPLLDTLAAPAAPAVSTGPGPAPRVSVVVPTCCRPDLLRQCLGALSYQTLAPSDYEVLVVDDGPTEDCRRLVEDWAGRRRTPPVRYLAAGPQRGPATARNLGWRLAQAEIVAFTDDDCLPTQDWLEQGLAAMAAPSVAAVCGRIRVPLGEDPTDYELNAAGLEAAPFATANCFYRKAALEEAGGFDERYPLAWREDSDLHFALLERGRHCRSCEEAVVVHPVRTNPGWGVSLRQQRNNLSDALLYKKYPALYRRLIRPLPAWRYYAIVASLIAFPASAAAGAFGVAAGAFLIWLGLTLHFCAQRLRRTSRRPGHVWEMLATSALIPPLALFWQWRGAIRYRVLFL